MRYKKSIAFYLSYFLKLFSKINLGAWLQPCAAVDVLTLFTDFCLSIRIVFLQLQIAFSSSDLFTSRHKS